MKHIKKIRGKITVYVIGAVSVFLCMSAGLADKPSFAGEWTLNEQKSVLGEFGARFTPKKIKVDQTESMLSLERTTSANGEDRMTPEKIKMDGKESENTVFGSAIKKSTLKWSDDMQSLTITSAISLDRNGQKLDINSTEVWKLTDPKTLSVETTSTSSMGTNTVKAVFDKK